jgi:GTP-dependent phosphoenolpyruvate carboxykinase
MEKIGSTKAVKTTQKIAHKNCKFTADFRQCFSPLFERLEKTSPMLWKNIF